RGGVGQGAPTGAGERIVDTGDGVDLDVFRDRNRQLHDQAVAVDAQRQRLQFEITGANAFGSGVGFVISDAEGAGRAEPDGVVPAAPQGQEHPWTDQGVLGAAVGVVEVDVDDDAGEPGRGGVVRIDSAERDAEERGRQGHDLFVAGVHRGGTKVELL